MVTMTTEELTTQPETHGRFQFNWLAGVLFRPRQGMAQVAAQTGRVWLTPMLVLTLSALGRVLVEGWLKQQAALMGEIQYPPDFQYYSPEMQAQFMQAQQATQSPVFLYVFPALIALLSVWVGWMLVSGLLHLVFTMLGGRGDTGSAFNLVAWGGLPFAIRDVVRLAAMLASKQLIQSPGLAGFATPGAQGFAAFIAALLAFVDIYLLWHILLLIVGVRAGNGLPAGKAAGGVLFTILLVVGLQALINFGIAQLGALTVVRPFF
jgi:hypothetical protein